MSAADSTDSTRASLSPTVLAAAAGRLPAWAVAGPQRLAHVARVVALMDEWARALDLAPADVTRWRAAAWLHDSLRDEEPETLRRRLGAEWQDAHGPILHGPAAAARLGAEVDEAVAMAISYHTLGHPALDRLGRALYLADFLEPGRDFLDEWRASLRARMPREIDAVLVEVVASRLCHLVDGRRPIREETAAFWSTLVDTRPK
jgi:HD superfamily phosphohydrolase YqeK